MRKRKKQTTAGGERETRKTFASVIESDVNSSWEVSRVNARKRRSRRNLLLFPLKTKREFVLRKRDSCFFSSLSCISFLSNVLFTLINA